MASLVIAQLLFLESESTDLEISMYINSPGGAMPAGLAIYDTMQHLAAPVATICAGTAASMGALLLAAGSPGRRSALPHSRMMIHQPLLPGGGIGGQVTDIAIYAREAELYKAQVHEILNRHTGQPLDRIRDDTERDHWFGAAEAREYGLIDQVLVGRPRLGAGVLRA